MTAEKRERKQIIKTAAIVLLSFVLLYFEVQAHADEIVADPDGLTDLALAAEDAANEPAADDAASAVDDGTAGLFVDTGNDVVSRKGESLEEAREEDYGTGDGGSTVNIGHLYLINGVYVRNSDFPSEHNECWAYANNIYAKIWGHNFWSEFSDVENSLRNLSDEELTLTPEHLKAYVSAAPAGAALRICNEDYLHGNDIGGHSQIIISHDENGFTVFEGGLSAWPHRREAYYTWNGFCYGWPGKYHYIKYVKWPGAPAWEPGMAGGNAQDLGESRMEKLQPVLKQTFQDLVRIVSDMVRGDVDRKDLKRLTSAIETVTEAAEKQNERRISVRQRRKFTRQIWRRQCQEIS